MATNGYIHDEHKHALRMPPVIILCGGKGTRLRDVSTLIPKPMVPIGDAPILQHILELYKSYGVTQAILCLGYKGEVIREYFSKPGIIDGMEIIFADTGLESQTALRIAIATNKLKPDDTQFFLTYGDGVADLNIAELLATHNRLGRLITVSAVHPPARFGEMIIDGDAVVEFREKPAVTHDYINGGFMVVERKLAEELLSVDKNESFEFTTMPAAASAGDMSVYKHEGFWQCMDTPREYAYLNELWNAGHAPWKKDTK